MRVKKLVATGIILVLGMTVLLEAQRRGRRGGLSYVKRPEHITWNSDFTFCRLAYREAYDGDGGGWGVDYPRAVVDQKGRVIVFISHNTDFGDSYEREADDPTYFYNFSVEGYAIGINILLYAMTH